MEQIYEITFDEVRDRKGEEIRGYKVYVGRGWSDHVSFSLRDLDNHYVVCNQSGTPQAVRDDKGDALNLAHSLIKDTINEWKKKYIPNEIFDYPAYRKKHNIPWNTGH